VSFAAINLCVASQRVFIVFVVVVYSVIDSVRKIWIHLVWTKFRNLVVLIFL
jgi:hypothetical protein